MLSEAAALGRGGAEDSSLKICRNEKLKYLSVVFGRLFSQVLVLQLPLIIVAELGCSTDLFLKLECPLPWNNTSPEFGIVDSQQVQWKKDERGEPPAYKIGEYRECRQ
jgi:hypothetical protein